MTEKNHLNDLQTSAYRMLLHHSDNPELKFYFKDLVEKLGYIEKLLYIEPHYNMQGVLEALEDVLNKDKELTDVCLNIHIKDSLKEKKEANLYFKLE